MTSAIDRAITAAARPRPRAQAIMRAEATIRVASAPVHVRKSGDLRIVRQPNADPDDGLLLVYDAKLDAYRPVLMPPGSAWELVETKPRERRTIWLPPGVSR